MANITGNGATGTTLAEYKARVEDAYLDIDPAWNIEPSTPDGLAIAVWCEMLASLDEAVINAYQSVDPNSAVGQQLDRIAAFAGLPRKAATYSTAIVTFTGGAGIAIPSGTQVKHRVTGTIWKTGITAVTGDDGSVSLTVTCTTSGEQNANAGTLTVLSTVIGGITSVTNEDAASLGTEEESDDAFRVRRSESVASIGAGQNENLYSKLLNLDGVKQVRIYENDGVGVDENGLYGHSIAIFVDGGGDIEIAQAIISKKGQGSGLNKGNNIGTSVDIVLSSSIDYPLPTTFFRPEYITIYVRIEIHADSELDEDAIKSDVVDYSIYGFTETNGFSKTGFKIGEDVSSGRLYTPVNYTVGNNGYVSAIKIGISPDDVNSTLIETSINHLGVFHSDNIEIAYV